MSFDLSTFDPEDEDELLDGILTYTSETIGKDWKKIKDNVESYLGNVAYASFRTLRRLKEGSISQREADLLLHAQELALNQVLLYGELSSYVLAQKILDSVFVAISAAIKNKTGIDLFRL
jgi:hypothetical protein